MYHLVHLLIFAIAVLIAARVVPGIRVKSFGSALLFAFVVAVLDTCLHGLLVFLALPMIVLTLGLFLLVINGFIWWLADKFVTGVTVDGFGSAMLGSLVTSVLSSVLLWCLR